MKLGKDRDMSLHNILNNLEVNIISSSPLSIGLYYSLERQLESIPFDWYERLYEEVGEEMHDREGGL